MRLIMLADGLGLGGSERTASILSSFLAKRGHEVVYVCVSHERVDYVLDPRIEVLKLGVHDESRLGRLIKRSILIERLLNARAHDVALSFVPRETAYASLRGHRIAQSVRNDPKHVRPINRPFYSLALRKAPIVVFQTDGARNCYGNAIRNKGVVLPNPFDASALPKWDFRKRDNRFVAVGRLSPQKNFSMLVDAFVKFHDACPGFELHIFGEETSEAVQGSTGQRAMLEDKIRAAHADGYIKLRGFSTNVYEDLAHAYAFVMSSDYEGVSNSMLEALCMGVPSIVTDHPPGGAREYIRHGENGWLTCVGDADDMCAALIKFANNQTWSAGLGLNALELRDELTVDKVCMRWESALMEMCQ